MVNPTILVVEDEEAIRELLGLALAQFGFAFHLASGGEKAIEAYRKQAFDLVLMDVQMPGLDGPQTLAALKRINPAVICCFMSADTGKYTFDDLNQERVTLIRKPFRLDDLKQTLLSVLEESAPAPFKMEGRETDQNRRAFRRRSVNAGVKAVCLHDSLHSGENLAKGVFDISEEGVRLALKVPLEIGEEVSLRLEAPPHKRPVTCAGQVAWSKRKTAESYWVGLRLKQALAHADLCNLA